MVLHNVFEDPVVRGAFDGIRGCTLWVVLEQGATNSADVRRIFDQVKSLPQ
jgi:hypothetical protein